MTARFFFDLLLFIFWLKELEIVLRTQLVTPAMIERLIILLIIPLIQIDQAKKAQQDSIYSWTSNASSNFPQRKPIFLLNFCVEREPQTLWGTDVSCNLSQVRIQSWLQLVYNKKIFCIFIRYFSAIFCSQNFNYFHFFPAFVRWVLPRKTERSWEWSPPRRREIILYMSDRC